MGMRGYYGRLTEKVAFHVERLSANAGRGAAGFYCRVHTFF